ncbi:patatin-like phospholipase family protein [Mycetohabitans sp. B2]|uniref:patatin-like phospholipase family protein n=1 Tax=Mycetohabitans sp. B2 TaxID=2841274 RepID=UPI001F010A4D|nr:patatin-like phospholipase family protein [Mycetohabitans sp. B2]MCF7695866.1 patatin-like phospholipase family protein [Mycetohabitans sp. B2]
MSFKIISFDGGGIRGLISALLVKDLDDKFNIINRSDGFVGTSTGGLLALGLAQKTSILKIVDIYKNKGYEIFKHNSRWWKPERDLAEKFGNSGLLHCKYVNDGLKDVVQGLLGSALMSSAEPFVAVNSAQLWDKASDSWVPCMFSNCQENGYRNITMADAALATSAAPTYFPPYRVTSNNLGYFVDGGVFANNPSIVAISEALYSGVATDLGSIRMLSLGTGRTPVGIKPAVFDKHDPNEWGVTYWLWPELWEKIIPPAALLSLTMDATAELAVLQAEKMLGNHYQRANFMLSQPYALDDWQHVDLLEERTNQYLSTQEWNNVCNWIDQNWQ